MGEREPLTPWQKAALEVYANGDFSHITDYRYDDDHGDSLLIFVLAELSTNEDCESLEMAKDRIRSGISDLQAVLEALEKLDG